MTKRPETEAERAFTRWMATRTPSESAPWRKLAMQPQPAFHDVYREVSAAFLAGFEAGAEGYAEYAEKREEEP